MVTRSSGVEAAALQTLNQLSSFLVQQIFVALIFPSAVFTVAFLRRPIHSGVSMSGHEHHHHHVPAADSGSMVSSLQFLHFFGWRTPSCALLKTAYTSN
jgi:hypothetical protein